MCAYCFTPPPPARARLAPRRRPASLAAARERLQEPSLYFAGFIAQESRNPFLDLRVSDKDEKAKLGRLRFFFGAAVHLFSSRCCDFYARA